MFSRFASLARERGGTVILRAQPELAPLLSRLDTVDQFAPSDLPAPPADVWSSIADLPALIRFASDADFRATPSISAPPERLDAMAQRLPARRGFRVGLVWAGNPSHPDDRNRSLPLATLLAPLGKIEGVELVSLQKSVGARDAADATDLTRADRLIADFADTAAVLTQLDLVISVDTSVLHLAGAMGRPAFALLPFAPDWRWRLTGERTPWYPSVRLFRQSRPRNWADVVDAAAAELRRLLS